MARTGKSGPDHAPVPARHRGAPGRARSRRHLECQMRAARVVELRGFEPLTFSLRTRRATNCATAPCAREREGKVTTETARARIRCGGQAPATLRSPPPDSLAASVFSAASRARLESAWSCPELLMPVSSIVRTVRRARALLT